MAYASKVEKHAFQRGVASATPCGNSRGFTLIELIAVLVVVGVLSAVVAPRFGGLTPFYERLFYDEAVAAVRYARQRAVDMECPFGVLFGTQASSGLQSLRSPGGFLVVASPPCGVINTNQFFSAVPRPDSPETENAVGFFGVAIDDPYDHENPRDLGVENALIAFDPLGRPFAGNAPLLAPASVCVAQRLITVTQNTGRVVRNGPC